MRCSFGDAYLPEKRQQVAEKVLGALLDQGACNLGGFYRCAVFFQFVAAAEHGLQGLFDGIPLFARSTEKDAIEEIERDPGTP